MQLIRFFCFLLVSFFPLGMCHANEFRDSAAPYEKLEFNIENETVTVAVRESFEKLAGEKSSSAGERHESIVSINCEHTCGSFQERVYGCGFGAFQFLPGSEDIVTVWMPDCLQPFKVIIYNISRTGVKKILDKDSGAPPQFLLGKSSHPDVLILSGLLNGEGVFHRWAWNGEMYAIAPK